MKSDVDKLLTSHHQLVHSEGVTVTSHTQRIDGDWVLHTLMIDGVDVPFKFKRQKKYKNLAGSKVNLTYYSVTEMIAGFEIEMMKVIRVKRY
ncbi:hypothetical protein [Photobacterium nomapromontoriensis]|uniref:hypothetical protein n=1 Tax=Photobacterium nomapromontoriensis TaxID=2910237 RepID=UPI003D148318